MRVKLITAEGEESFPEVPASGMDQLKALQKMVGGYVEQISLSNGVKGKMLVDEDGNYKDRQPNLLASVLAGRPIVGDAVLINTRGSNWAAWDRD